MGIQVRCDRCGKPQEGVPGWAEQVGGHEPPIAWATEAALWVHVQVNLPMGRDLQRDYCPECWDALGGLLVPTFTDVFPEHEEAGT